MSKFRQYKTPVLDKFAFRRIAMKIFWKILNKWVTIIWNLAYLASNADTPVEMLHASLNFSHYDIFHHSTPLLRTTALYYQELTVTYRYTCDYRQNLLRSLALCQTSVILNKRRQIHVPITVSCRLTLIQLAQLLPFISTTNFPYPPSNPPRGLKSRSYVTYLA